MTRHSTRSARRILPSLAALLTAAISLPAAANVCVSCTGPDANYACAIAGSSMPDDDPRYKLLCITELAKTGGHQSCAVSRAVTAPCAGEAKSIAAPGADVSAPTFAAPVASPPPDSVAPRNVAPPTPAVAPQETVTTVPKTSPPPRTADQAVEDGASSARESSEKSGQGANDIAKSASGMMQKAGQVVGDAAKSTWKCLSTLFGDC